MRPPRDGGRSGEPSEGPRGDTGQTGGRQGDDTPGSRVGDTAGHVGPDTDRAVSTSLGYVLTLTITALLISGLLLSTGTLIENRRQQVVREGLAVAGQALAADLMTADRLARADAERVLVESDLQAAIADSDYTVIVDPAPDGHSTVRLRSNETATEVTVSFVNRTPVEATTVRGGDLVITLDDGTLEVTRP
ncbi:MAG: hypothetical protein ABEJ08_03985 [Halobacteriaceae archaeon]